MPNPLFFQFFPPLPRNPLHHFITHHLQPRTQCFWLKRWKSNDWMGDRVTFDVLFNLMIWYYGSTRVEPWYLSTRRTLSWHTYYTPPVMCSQQLYVLYRIDNPQVSKFYFPLCIWFLKNYSLVEFMYLLIRFYKRKFFPWNTNNTDGNGINKANTRTPNTQKNNFGKG